MRSACSSRSSALYPPIACRRCARRRSAAADSGFRARAQLIEADVEEDECGGAVVTASPSAAAASSPSSLAEVEGLQRAGELGEACDDERLNEAEARREGGAQLSAAQDRKEELVAAQAGLEVGVAHEAEPRDEAPRAPLRSSSHELVLAQADGDRREELERDVVDRGGCERRGARAAHELVAVDAHAPQVVARPEHLCQDERLRRAEAAMLSPPPPARRRTGRG